MGGGGVGLAAVVALGLWFCLPAQEKKADSIARMDGAAKPGPTALPDKLATHKAEGPDGLPRLRLEIGDRLTYSVTQNHEVNLSIMTEFSFPAPTEKGSPALPSASEMAKPKTMETQQSMMGQLKMEVLADLVSDPDKKEPVNGWLVECSLTGMSMDLSIQGTEIPQDEEMRRQVAMAKDKLAGEAMQSRVQAEVAESGKIGKIVVQSESPEVRNQWRGILSRWQVILPETDEIQTWEQEEQDDTGTYVAKYEWASADYPRRLLKQKLRYTKLMLNSPGPAMQPDNAVEGQTRIVLEAYPISVNGWETKTVSSKGKGGFTVKGESRFSLELVSAENDSSLAARGAEAMDRFLQNTNVMAWSGEAGPPGGQQPPQTPEELEKLLDLLRKSIEFYGGDSPQALNIASLLIKALQSGGAELVNVIMDALSEDYSDVGYAMVLTGVLGAAGTPASQDGLLEIIGTDDWPLELKEMSYTSLAQISDPVPGTEAVLIEQAEKGPEAYRDTALLMLAHTGHHLEGLDDTRRSAVLDYIQGNLADVKAENYGRSLSVALAVLGNLGPSDVPDLVAAASQSDDPWVRSEALASLTRVQTDEATRLIVQGMQDADETVRLSAVRTYGEQNPVNGLDALRQVVLNDPSENVRTLAASTLVNSYWGNDEAVKTLLTEVSQNDASEQVRSTAEAMLPHLGARPWGTTGDDDPAEGRPAIP